MEFLLQLLSSNQDVTLHIVTDVSYSTTNFFINNNFSNFTLYVEKTFKASKDQFEKFVICPKCCSLYTFGECVQTSITGRDLPKSCNHVTF